MSSVRASLVALLLLSACGGNPFPASTGGDDVTSGSDDVPAAVARDMNAMSYSDGVLKIDMQGVTSSPKLATFVRAAKLDVPNGAGNPGYEAYVYHETGMTRSYLAYVAKNARGNLVAVAGSDGGQFNEHNGGGRYVRVTAYTNPVIGTGPEEGLFSYAGSYVGVFAPGEFADGSSPRPPELRPVEPFYVKGTAQVNGDFAHGSVEGGIVNRQLYTQDGTRVTGLTIDDGDPSTVDKVIDTTTLTSLVLRETHVTADGTFLGNVEFSGKPDAKVGDYGGAFGGTGATDVAGVLWLHPIQGQNGIWEYGAFNLPRCDVAGASPLCKPR